MDKSKLKKIFLLFMGIFAVLTVSFYFLARNELRYKASAGNIVMTSADAVSSEIGGKGHILQYFDNEISRIEELSILFTQYYRESGGTVVVELLDGDNVLMRKKVDPEDIKDQRSVDFVLQNPIGDVKGKHLILDIYSEDGADTGIAVMMDRTLVRHNWFIRMDHRVIEGTICFAMSGSDESLVDDYYWYIMSALTVLLSMVLYLSYKLYARGRVNYLVAAILAVYNYKFLISQLVIRDFKSKYKRSILGVFWSFLNPLLTMTVQFLVFSTFFKADTQNYPVYLLSGVVCFSFFSECTTMCLSSISGNARLITKVYIPKYIFPLSRTISSSVNLGISLIPLFLACLVLGVHLQPQALLFFYFLACLVVFSLGIGLFLSALMVYFRDIQFLWMVITQVWMYATPIFYPAEIVPDKYRFILRINPLYHFIGNARTCLINGVSPEPQAYVFCLLFALLSLGIGALTFKKTQDNFALYL